MRIDNGQFFSASFLDAVNTGITAQGGITSSAQISANTLNSDGVIFTAGTGSIRNSSNGLLVGHTAQFQSVQLGRAGTDMNLVGTLATSLTASGTVAISGANAINGDRLTADSYVQTPSIQNSGGVLSVSPPTTFVSSVTASADISASGNFFGDEFHAHGDDGNSGFTLQSLGDKPSVLAVGASVQIGNTANAAQTGINLVGEVTASGTISGASEVNAVTGSFSHMVGNSPITFGSPVTFLSASNFQTSDLTISGSLTVSGSGTFNNIGPFNQTGDSTFTGNVTASSVESPKFTFTSASIGVGNMNKVTVTGTTSTIADGAFQTLFFSNNKSYHSAVVVGNFTGRTDGPITASIIQVSTADPNANHNVTFYRIFNETGVEIPSSTPFTASFLIF